MESDREKRLILWFDDIIIDDVALVGGKTASLGEMYQKLISQGVNVPWGFAKPPMPTGILSRRPG